MDRIKLSVVISAFNEEKYLKDCLESVKDLADEIIVVDNSSTDKTAETVSKYTKKIFKQENNPLKLDLQKNFGFSKASGDWVLSLDADERVSPELSNEIKTFLNGEAPFAGYWIPRKNIIFGKWIEHTGWYPDDQVRLFKKGKGEYKEKHVHEMIKVDGDVGNLKEHLIHINYETISQFLYKHINYAQNEAEHLIDKGYELNFIDIIRFPLKEFLSRFFAREGYKDGFYGLMLSLLMAFYHLIIFAKIWEMKKFPDNKNALPILEKGITDAKKEVKYWLVNEKIKGEKSVAKKMLLKFQGKFNL